MAKGERRQGAPWRRQVQKETTEGAAQQPRALCPSANRSSPGLLTSLPTAAPGLLVAARWLHIGPVAVLREPVPLLRHHTLQTESCQTEGCGKNPKDGGSEPSRTAFDYPRYSVEQDDRRVEDMGNGAVAAHHECPSTAISVMQGPERAPSCCCPSPTWLLKS